MFELETISDDEIDYFRHLSDSDSDSDILNYISKKVNNDSDLTFKYPIKTSHKVTANIATQPHRFERLLSMLNSIDGQFDEIRLYLNNFSYVPDELKKYTTYIGDDLTDNGKFFWSNNQNEYYFTLDDDIIYPSDYVQKTLPLIGDRIISYHGRILTGRGRGYYGKHKAYMYHWSLERERRLDIMGTGVSAFDTDIFKPNLWKTPNYKMTDLTISLEAHMCGIQIISPIKEKNWLSHDEISFDGICYDLRDKDDDLSLWVDMIYTLTKSNIDLSKLNYKYSRNSINELSDFIKNKSQENSILINLRTGNGSLIDKLCNLLDFRTIYSFDTDSERVDKCAKLYLDNHVQFKHISKYSDLQIKEKDCFVFLDDIILLNSTSTDVFHSMKVGSRLICHNFVRDVFPDDKITLRLEDGRDIEFFYYLKK